MTQGTLNIAMATAVMAAALISTPLAAYEAGDWLVRGRIISVSPDESSSTLASSVAGNLGTKVGVDTDIAPEVDFTYMLNPHWGVELILASSQHRIKDKGLGLGNIAEVRSLPPTLTLQYHFRPHSRYQPYAGIGVNYTLFFDEDESSLLKAAGGGKADVDLDESIGIALQVGIDVTLNRDWFMNFDVKYIDMSADVSISTAAASGLGKLKTDVDIDPWIYGIGIGRRF